jgi:hypothetical protein
LFEGLFQHFFHNKATGGGGVASLDFEIMSDAPFTTVCLDPLMYESDDLFHAAMTLLVRKYSTKLALCKLLPTMQILVQEKNMRALSETKAILHHLQYCMDSFPVWGMGNYPELTSGQQEQQRDSIATGLVSKLARLIDFVSFNESTGTRSTPHQNILRHCHAHEVVIRALVVRQRVSAPTDPPPRQARIGAHNRILSQVHLKCYQLLRVMVVLNSANQKLLHGHLPFLVGKVDAGVGVGVGVDIDSSSLDEVTSTATTTTTTATSGTSGTSGKADLVGAILQTIGAVFEGNYDLASRVPRGLLHDLCDMLAQHVHTADNTESTTTTTMANKARERGTYMRFFKGICVIEGKPIRPNQQIMMQLLPGFPSLMTWTDHAGRSDLIREYLHGNGAGSSTTTPSATTTTTAVISLKPVSGPSSPSSPLSPPSFGGAAGAGAGAGAGEHYHYSTTIEESLSAAASTATTTTTATATATQQLHQHVEFLDLLAAINLQASVQVHAKMQGLLPSPDLLAAIADPDVVPPLVGVLCRLLKEVYLDSQLEDKSLGKPSVVHDLVGAWCSQLERFNSLLVGGGGLEGSAPASVSVQREFRAMVFEGVLPCCLAYSQNYEHVLASPKVKAHKDRLAAAVFALRRSAIITPAERATAVHAHAALEQPWRAMARTMEVGAFKPGKQQQTNDDDASYSASQQSDGNSGGGGDALTPQQRELLHFARRLESSRFIRRKVEEEFDLLAKAVESVDQLTDPHDATHNGKTRAERALDPRANAITFPQLIKRIVRHSTRHITRVTEQGQGQGQGYGYGEGQVVDQTEDDATVNAMFRLLQRVVERKLTNNSSSSSSNTRGMGMGDSSSSGDESSKNMHELLEPILPQS